MSHEPVTAKDQLMQKIAKPTSLMESQAENEAIDTAKPRIRWGYLLVWFMRVTAIVWVIKGLGNWLVILGAEGMPTFEGRALSFQATIVYFSVIDIVAAVGLWLTSAWGGVLWLLALMSHVILSIFFPRIVGSSTAMLIVNFGLVVSYLTISWLASREDR
jgi:hypothetical protein